MNHLHRKLGMAALLLIGLVAVLPAEAARLYDGHPIQTGTLQDSAQISRDQAVDIVRSRYGGQVLGVRLRNQGGRSVYYVKILTDEGRVRTIKVDGITGRII